MIPCSKFQIGVCFIIVVTVIWTISSFMTQFIYTNLDFKSPFILTYLSSSFFSLYLPIWYLQVFFKTRTDQPLWSRKNHSDGRVVCKHEAVIDTSNGDWSRVSSIDCIAADSSNSSSSNNSNSDAGAISPTIDSIICDDDVMKKKLLDDGHQSSTYDETDSIRWLRQYIPTSILQLLAPIQSNYCHTDLIKAAFILCPLWMLANCFYNYSLLYTSVGSSTIISNLSGSFTLFFSYLFQLESITYGKIAGLICCFVGVILVSLNDQGDGTHHGLVGDLLAIVGAIGYGLYTTVLKLKIPSDDDISMQLFFGYLGIVNAVLFLPVIIIFAVGSYDDIGQLTANVFGYILLECIFDTVIADYLWARSVLLTTPTVATVGLSLTIPFAICSDVLTGNRSDVNALSLSGAFLVTLGFVFVNIDLTGLIYGTNANT